MKILSVIPSLQLLGGVASHYQGLAPYWKEDMRYLTYGKRNNIPAYLTLIPDYLHFIYILIFSKIDVIIINPSLRYYQISRDGIYLLIARLFRKKVVTFIHGWDQNLYDKIKKHPSLFCWTYGKSQFIYTLYSGYRNDLKALPLSCPILLTTTKVSDSLVKDFDITKRDGKIHQLLFLARVEKYKGIDITINAYELLKKKYPMLRLCVCGTGNALNDAKEYVHKQHIQDVSFEGFVKGDDRIHYFIKSQIYILPTYGEGMATSILEAMAMGQIVISRPVGGVVDFFENRKMGFLLESLEPQDYADAIEKVLENQSLAKQIAENNYKYATEHFLASKVANKIEEDISKYCND